MVPTGYSVSGTLSLKMRIASVNCRGSACLMRVFRTWRNKVVVNASTGAVMDLTPLGRQEDGEPAQGWIRHHDRYGT